MKRDGSHAGQDSSAVRRARCHSVLYNLFKGLEARVGIEPTHKGFADLSLTAWVPRHLVDDCTADQTMPSLAPGIEGMFLAGSKAANWSGRRDLNPRPSPWQGDALPLSYSRIRPEAVYRPVPCLVNARRPGRRCGDRPRLPPVGRACPPWYRPEDGGGQWVGNDF